MTAEGDVHLMMLRLPEAIAAFDAARDEAGLRRTLEVALAFGKYRAVRALRRFVDEDRYRTFLRERALAGISIGGDAQRGFYVDEDAIAEIARELDAPVKPLLAETARRLLDGGSRNIAKLHVLANLSGDAALIEAIAPSFHARAAHPRRALAEILAPRAVLQAPDGDDYNPKVAAIFETHEGTILKENLALHIDPSRIDGYSDEAEILKVSRKGAEPQRGLDPFAPLRLCATHPSIVRLLSERHIHHHHLMELERAPGSELSGRLPPEEAARVVQTVSATLAELHARGVLYLDVKAKNVLHDGARTTLVDFGMARKHADDTPVWTLHSTAECVAPETAVGFRASRATDVFQLGLLYFRLLTGRHAFAGVPLPRPEAPREEEMRLFALANLRDPPLLDLAPAPARPLLAAMLAKDPADRPRPTDVEETLR